MKTFRVVQTVACFKYPKGKIWGPYIDRDDAEKRVETLESFKGAGLIDEGDFGPPCFHKRPPSEDGMEKV